MSAYDLPAVPFPIDWASPVELAARYVTRVTRGLTGAATRISERDHGHRELLCSFLLSAALRRAFDAWRELYPPGTHVALPLWCDDGVELVEDAAAAAVTLVVSETDHVDWRSAVVLLSHVNDDTLPVVEAGMIDAAAGGTITLQDGLTNEFLAGSRVLPVLRCRVPEDFDEEPIDEETSQITMRFVEDLDDMAACGLTGSALSFLGVPILPLVPDWGSLPRDGIGQGISTWLEGSNAEVHGTLQTYCRQQNDLDLVMTDRWQIALLRAFLDARRGRWGRFWLPRWKQELKLSANVSAADTTLKLENFSAFSDRYNLGGSLRKTLFIVNGSSFWIRRVLNLSGGTDRITIDAAIGTALAKEQTLIGTLELVRLASDDLAIAYDEPTFATARIAVIELEKEYGEVLAAGGTLNGSIDSSLVLVSP